MSRISAIVNKIMQISGKMSILDLVSFDKGFKGEKVFHFRNLHLIIYGKAIGTCSINFHQLFNTHMYHVEFIEMHVTMQKP